METLIRSRDVIKMNVVKKTDGDALPNEKK